MDIKKILSDIESADNVTLYELKIALDKILVEHDRLEPVRQNLKSGQRIQYFCEKKKSLASGTIVQVQRTQTEILLPNSTSTKMVPLAALKLASTDSQAGELIAEKQALAEKLRFNIGQRVKFLDKQNQAHVAQAVCLATHRVASQHTTR